MLKLCKCCFLVNEKKLFFNICLDTNLIKNIYVQDLLGTSNAHS